MSKFSTLQVDSSGSKMKTEDDENKFEDMLAQLGQTIPTQT